MKWEIDNSQGCETGKRTTFWSQFFWVLNWDFINNLNSTSQDSCQKSKIVNFDLWFKLKSVINFKLVASVGFTLLASLRIMSQITIVTSESKNQFSEKAVKNCWKVIQIACYVCRRFFTSKDVKIESRTADLWAHTRCMHDLAFPFKK